MMAGDWVAMRTELPNDPAVLQLAQRLELDVDAVIGKLLRLWGWADQHLDIDGLAPGATPAFIDELCRCAGFAAALGKIRPKAWLIFGKNGAKFPDFSRWNSSTAKSRLAGNRRVCEHRKRNCNATGVTESLPPNQTKPNQTNMDGETKKILHPPIQSQKLLENKKRAGAEGDAGAAGRADGAAGAEIGLENVGEPTADERREIAGLIRAASSDPTLIETVLEMRGVTLGKVREVCQALLGARKRREIKKGAGAFIVGCLKRRCCEPLRRMNGQALVRGP